MMGSNNGSPSQFGDTTLTKVFVGGLAWETPKDTLREHFEKYGDILEAVIISDKVTGRSKGYGFVTFKDADSAKKACEEPTVIINGRRANCNIASLGARRPRSSPITPPPSPPPLPYTQGGTKNIHRRNQQQVQWYYPVVTPTPPSSIFHHHHALPFYGYTPTYIATDHMNYNYNQKLSYGMGGGYVYPPPRQAIVGAMPIMYHHPAPVYRSTEAMAMGVPPPQIFHQTHQYHYAPSITPTTGTVGTGECFKRVVV
ncbi:probable RNA-binding protein ARP1 isoform X2 [Medicago truncatula]|uniref:probable RNA-binding protein ARP1 isoform X2 n=1 Tax=Medicago truncatula TaxID=3880 RepID=UPI000D2F267C|nr:probable RNA-binding protein ARP1 isoform X2 [Medicago truncatula]